MTILSVVQDVCEAVGVAKIDSLFSGSGTDRTKQEFLALANETAQKIAYDSGHDWTMLKVVATFVGDGTTAAFPLPANYKRMLLTSNVRNSAMPRTPMLFVPDFDQWVERRLNNDTDSRGEWTIAGGFMSIEPPPAVGVQIKFPYLDKNCIVSGDTTDVFAADTDTFRLNERALKLGMIVGWKSNKGTPYSEDMGSYGDCLTGLMGRDSPSPIIIDRMPSSWSTKTAYPWMAPT